MTQGKSVSISLFFESRKKEILCFLVENQDHGDFGLEPSLSVHIGTLVDSSHEITEVKLVENL